MWLEIQMSFKFGDGRLSRMHVDVPNMPEEGDYHS